MKSGQIAVKTPQKISEKLFMAKAVTQRLSAIHPKKIRPEKIFFQNLMDKFIIPKVFVIPIRDNSVDPEQSLSLANSKI